MIVLKSGNQLLPDQGEDTYVLLLRRKFMGNDRVCPGHYVHRSRWEDHVH